MNNAATMTATPSSPPAAAKAMAGRPGYQMEVDTPQCEENSRKTQQ